MVWPLIAGIMGARGAMGLAGSVIGGLGSLAGGVASGLGSLGGGLLSGAGSMLSGGRGGGGGGAVAPSFGAQPFAGGAPLALSAPGASRALVPSGGGGELDAAMGGALTAQQSQQTTIISLLQQIAATVGVIAQNTAGLIGIQSAQLSGQQQAIEDQRTQLSLKGGETDDTTKETGPKPRWFANPLGKTGQKMLDFMKNPLPAAIGLFGIWWWLRNNMDVFEKVLVPILRFFKNLQEDPEGTWKSLKKTVKTFAMDAFTKIGHKLGDAVLGIFGFQFKDDKSWDIIAQPSGKWDALNPFSGEITLWTRILDAYKFLFLGYWPDKTRIFKGKWADWMYPEDGKVTEKWVDMSANEGFFKSLVNLLQLKWPDGTSMFAFLADDAPWKKDFFSDQNIIIKSFKKDFFGLMEFDWFDKIDNWFKNDFRMFMENLVPSKETLAKMVPDIDFEGMLNNFTKFIYDKGPPEKFMNMDINVLKNALPSMQEFKKAWNDFMPHTWFDFKDVGPAEVGKWGGGSMIGAEAGVQERASTISDLKSKLVTQQAQLKSGDTHTGADGWWGLQGTDRRDIIKQLESELTRLGVPLITSATDIGASTKTLQTVTTEEQMLNAAGINTAPIVIDGSTTSSLAQNINQISQAELSSQNEESTARGIVYPRYGSLLGMAIGEYR